MTPLQVTRKSSHICDQNDKILDQKRNFLKIIRAKNKTNIRYLILINIFLNLIKCIIELCNESESVTLFLDYLKKLNIFNINM